MNDSDDEAQAHADAMVDAAMQSWRQDQIASYLNRGRPYAGLSDDALRAAWCGAVRKVAATVRSPSRPPHLQAVDDLTDLDCELRLRGIKEPVDEVRAEFAAIAQQASHDLKDSENR